ncbi:XRE family transcriptional regulator [uncultured Megasphaera sp.]|uniref:helix-turn-helix domain-containing protein n=1 Tax=uncultured Megasphaera sp. TaxID=165188 RepID=UPI002659572F|nr:XRE family transcriptional regulator [uncultured Megasphaera sp.]
MYIGELIKSYRKKHGLSMQDFANISGISKAYIGVLEKIYNPTTGEPIAPSLPKIKAIAKAMGLDLDALLKLLDEKQPVIVNSSEGKIKRIKGRGVRIPVLGRVVAGIPIEAVEEILDYEEITPELAATGEFFALQIHGDSMLPTLKDGDIVIVKQQPTVDSGDIAIVLVNGNEATVKEVKESPAGITLIGHNVAVYTPKFYSNHEIADLPVQVLGKVVEMRRKF